MPKPRKAALRFAALIESRLRKGGYRGRLDEGNPIYLLQRAHQTVRVVRERLEDLGTARMAVASLEKVMGRRRSSRRTEATRRVAKLQKEISAAAGDLGIFALMLDAGARRKRGGDR